MLSSFVYLECRPRPFTLSLDRRFRPGRKGLTSLQSVFPDSLPTDHCPPTCPDPVGVILPTIALNPLAATLMDLPASVANKKLTVQLSPLAATLTKNSRGGGAMVFPGRTSMPVRCHVLSPLFATLRKTAGCVTQLSHSGRGVLPTFKPSSFKPSNDPLVPLQPNALGATIGNDTRIFHDPGKQVRSPRCLTLRERTSGTVSHRSRSQTPIRSELQVVPRSNVLMLDRSAGWLALQRRAGKAGSVRLG